MAEVVRTAVATPVQAEDVRAGDADRERVVERLGRAQAEGRLDLFEYDDRLRAAWGARTLGELERVIADLPVQPEPVVRPAPAKGHGVDCRRPAVGAWVFASSVNLAIWAVVSIAATSWVYPWWIWVAGPWGAVLLAGWVAGRVVGDVPERR